MQPSLQRVTASPVLVRVIPFVLFVALTAGQGAFGDDSRYWLYLAKTVLGAWMIFVVWPHIAEMRWALSWEAVAVGIGIFAIWVGLDGLYPSADELLRLTGLGGGAAAEAGAKWNPPARFGESSAMAWLFIAVRFLGSVLVVPPLEEVFYRSFVYRYIAKADFQSVPLHHLALAPLLITAAIFGFAHFEWLPGILCALAYQGLVIRKRRLGDAMTAHAITNLLLGAWVVWKGAWHFW